MNKLTIGWMYPNLLNLHGERGSVQMLEYVGKKMGLDIEIRRIESFKDPIPFDELDLLFFLPGEIELFNHIIPALNKQKEQLDQYLENGGYLLALGTSGLMFGKTVTRENGKIYKCLGYLDMVSKERKYVWGDDLRFRIDGTKQEIVGSQIQMADVATKDGFGTVIYGRGNNNDGKEGSRWKNLIYTNCLGPLFVKNPWFCQSLLQEICAHKFLGLSTYTDQIASNSYDATIQFIDNKPKQ